MNKGIVLALDFLVEHAPNSDSALSDLLEVIPNTEPIRGFIKHQNPDIQNELCQAARIAAWQAVRGENKWDKDKGKSFVNFILVATKWACLNLFTEQNRQRDLIRQAEIYKPLSSNNLREVLPAQLIVSELFSRAGEQLKTFLRLVMEGHTYLDAYKIALKNPALNSRQIIYQAHRLLAEAKSLITY